MFLTVNIMCLAERLTTVLFALHVFHKLFLIIGGLEELNGRSFLFMCDEDTLRQLDEHPTTGMRTYLNKKVPTRPKTTTALTSTTLDSTKYIQFSKTTFY